MRVAPIALRILLVLIPALACAQSFEIEIDGWDVIVSKTANGLKFTVPQQAQPKGGLVTESAPQIGPPAAAPPPLELLEVSCSPVDPKLTQKVLGKAVAKLARMWNCFVTNAGSEPVLVSENSLLRHLGMIAPYDRQTFEMALGNVVKYSTLERIERILADGVRLTALTGVGGFAALPVKLTLAATAFNAEEPYIQSRLHGIEIPVMSNYQALTTSGTIAPGTTAIYHLFGSLAAPSQSVQFTIAIGNLARIRSL